MHANQTEDLLIRQAQPGDWVAVEALLRASGLPLDGARDHLAHFLVGERGGTTVCAAGMERYGDVALLRSVVVAADARGLGYGERIARAVLQAAKRAGVRQAVLLTTTAGPYFARRGFSEIPRGAAPAAVQASREFQGACPASATVMAIHL